MHAEIEWDGKVYTYDPEDINVRHGFVIKQHTGLDLKPWEDSLRDGNVASWQALMWLLKQQNGERTQIATEDFAVVKFMNTFNAAMEAASEEEAKRRKAESEDGQGNAGAKRKRGSTPD